MITDSTLAVSALQTLAAIYERARVVAHNNQLTTLNEFTDQVAPLRADTLAGLAAAVHERIKAVAFDLVCGEEDKGAHIATAVALATGRPLSLARWYVYPLPVVEDSVVVDLRSEYYDGHLILNGIAPGTRALIVDDTLSTGGTLIALVKAIRARGADVVGAVAVVEKVGGSGRERVRQETGLDVETLLRIRVTPDRVYVL